MVTRAFRWKQLKTITAVLLGIAIGISVVPTGCFAAGASDEKEQIMVSLGDSYSSGEGIEPFYGQSKKLSERVTDPDWLAHRSQNAWSGMLSLPSISGKMSDHKDENWFFVAASGAVTDNMLNSFRKEYQKGFHSGSYDLAPQLEVFDTLGSKKADYVTLTLGGNDAGFTDIITACVAGSTYLNFGGLTDKLNNTWVEFFKENGIRDKLYKAYQDVSDRAGSQAQIIVAGYPQLLSPTGSVSISIDEASIVNENVSKFNRAIKNIVISCQGTGIPIHFVSVEEAFEGHGAYSLIDPYINKVEIGANSQDLQDFMLASAYSIHPNYAGAQAYARCVQAKIDELENTGAAYEYNPQLKAAVYDRNDNLYGDYTIEIEGKEYTGLFKWGLFKNDYSKTITVDSAKVVKFILPKGDYTITVIDGANGNHSYKKDVLIRPGSKNNALTYRTDFGVDALQ